MEQKEQKLPKKVGRKRIELDLEQVENLAARGLGTSQIARAMGVSWNTIDRNRKRSEDFEESIKRGKARGLAQVTNALFESATEKNSVVAQIFYLKNQDPKIWKDRVENVHATLDLNQVIDGAKNRLGKRMTNIIDAKEINPLHTSDGEGEQLVSKKLNQKNQKG
jgi:hypothetical protein